MQAIWTEYGFRTLLSTTRGIRVLAQEIQPLYAIFGPSEEVGVLALGMQVFCAKNG